MNIGQIVGEVVFALVMTAIVVVVALLLFAGVFAIAAGVRLLWVRRAASRRAR